MTLATAGGDSIVLTRAILWLLLSWKRQTRRVANKKLRTEFFLIAVANRQLHKSQDGMHGPVTCDMAMLRNGRTVAVLTPGAWERKMVRNRIQCQACHPRLAQKMGEPGAPAGHDGIRVSVYQIGQASRFFTGKFPTCLGVARPTSDDYQ